MTVNVDKLKETFFQESDEHLNFVESALVQFDVDAPDMDQINSIFRAIHSVKGGAGIFGFDVLISLAHSMENLLDLARKGSLRIDDDTLTALLNTNDMLRNLFASYAANQELDESIISDVKNALEACFHKAGKKSNDEGNIEAKDSPEASERNVERLLDDPELKFGFNTEKRDTTESQNSAQVAGQDFGFFTEQQQDSETGSFGLFDEPTAKSNTHETFGFFDEKTSSGSDSNKSTEKTQNNAKSNVQRISAAQQKTSCDKKRGISSSIRVDTQKIDSLVNLVGELVITQSILQVIGAEATDHLKQRLQLAITDLKRNTREIQDSVMSMRMVPISQTFDRFPRVARDLSTQLGKKIELRIEGGATEIDKGMIEKLTDPLTHLVRNSIDHGIEMPAQRLQAGKPEKGLITLRAEQSGGSILVHVIDDGAGLNRERILEKARNSGISCHDDMSDLQVWELIFEPGFSTAENITDVSGRGVGMDVVRRNIESIGGRIEIDSSEGKGCVFQIQLPLTLAILEGMCVTVGEQVFVIPMANIIESLQPLPSQLKVIANDRLLWIRDQYWPLVSLADFMQTDNPPVLPENGVVVLVQTNKKRFGLVVNNLVGQQQVVIKSLEKHYKRVAGIAGATIMGDGSVALITDVESIAAASKLNVPEYQEEIAV